MVRFGVNIIFGFTLVGCVILSSANAAIQTYDNSSRSEFDGSFGIDQTIINESFLGYVGGLWDPLCTPLTSSCTSASLPEQPGYFTNGISNGLSISAFQGEEKGFTIVGVPGELVNLSSSMLISPDIPGQGLDFTFDTTLNAFGFEAFNQHQSPQTLLIRAYNDQGDELGQILGSLPTYPSTPVDGSFFGFISGEGNIAQVSVISASFRAPTLYAGNLNIMPVPEAEIWIMMILGLGFISFVLHRRSKAEYHFSASV